MAPKGKSSASSATRKKHARKAAGPTGQIDGPAILKEKKGKEKKKNQEPRKKVYIPPAKPAPVQPDPLDTLGIAQRISPELLVVLRRLAKKDPTTKRRALEDLQAGWVDKARSESADSAISELVDTVPVWLHHLPALFIHPSRRIRLLAAGLHRTLLRDPTMREQLFFFIRGVASSEQSELILGTWCLAAHDIDRQVSAAARESWSLYVSPTPSNDELFLNEILFSSLCGLVQSALLNPSGVYLYVNPLQPVVTPPPTRANKGQGRPLPPRRENEEGAGARTRTEDEEEQEFERMVRLRIGAFGSAEWIFGTCKDPVKKRIPPDFLDLLSNSALWSALHHSQTPPFVDIEGFGYNQPAVRRAAWALLQTILNTNKDDVEKALTVLSTAVLRSAWVEPDPIVRSTMWQPLLVFLKAFPNAWELEARSEHDADGQDESEDEDEVDETTEMAHGSQRPKSQSGSARSHAYKEFLQFLELGCFGSPLQGYPTIIIILSTIPSPILVSNGSSSPVKELFTSFWAALDGRALSALDKTAASAAFLSSLLECMVFICRRWSHSTPEDKARLLPDEDGARRLVHEQIQIVWQELKQGRLKVEGSTAGALLARTLVMLHNTDDDLRTEAWNILSSGISNDIEAGDPTISPLVPAILKAFVSGFDGNVSLSSTAEQLTTKVVEIVVKEMFDAFAIIKMPSQERISSLDSILDAFGSTVFADAERTMMIDNMVRQSAHVVLSKWPSLLVVYLSHRADTAVCSQVWHEVLLAIASDAVDPGKLLLPLLDAAERKALPEYLKPLNNELGSRVEWISAEIVLEPWGLSHQVVRRLFCNLEPFLDDEGLDIICPNLISIFFQQFDGAIHDTRFPLEIWGSTSLEILGSALDLITASIKARPQSRSAHNTMEQIVPSVYFIAYLPIFRQVDARLVNMAQELWMFSMVTSQHESRTSILTSLKGLVRELLAETTVIPTPDEILRSLDTGDQWITAVDIFTDVFPSESELDSMLQALPSTPLDPSLAILDPLIPPASESESQGRSADQEYDSEGFPKYSRIVNALLSRVIEDRQAARDHAWTLKHVLALALYAKDTIQMRHIGNPIFADNISMEKLQKIVTRAEQVTTYLCSMSSVEAGWSEALLNAVLTGGKATTDHFGKVIYDLIKQSEREDTIRESRILRDILQHVFKDISKTEADQWMGIARNLEKTAPHASLAISGCISKTSLEPPRLERYRNELAAEMLGILPSKANSEGLSLLHKLAVIAPDPDSDVVFLPQLRAINLMKACQEWITTNDDLDENVESEMTLVFMHLAPILQNVTGSHWDLIFDVMETNLENASFNDNSTLIALHRTLLLVLSIEDLASTNKSLRASWEERRNVNMTLIRDLATTKFETSARSTPLSICRELTLQIVQDLPESLITREMLPKMCHTLQDTSPVVQRMTYQVLHEATRKYTEYMVIEAAVDAEPPVKPEIPEELIILLQRRINHEDNSPQSDQNLLGYFLTWMLVFDLFVDASLKVKTGYTDQLREDSLVSENLLPSILHILDLYEGRAKAFKLDIWAVDEYYLDMYSQDSLLSLQLFAAHLYYRALLVVPSLIRSWVLDCRDRQLSATVSFYTSTYFSPVIIKTQLARVKDAVSETDLVDESLTVKVASAVNEVTVSYAVDEHQLELSFKLPSDYPLRVIEIKDAKPVGVSEERWRAWVLGIQQILLFRNGNILDGLMFFKKNVTSHFEGVADCAICYSIISATDGSLPRIPCRTCKNRYHSGCLYKWFETSHSSSCPLCRSNIL